MTQGKAVRQAMLRTCSWVALDSRDWREDRYERMDPKEGRGWEETKDEEEGLRSVERLLLGG